MKIILVHKFEDIISVENLLEAWKEFIVGKKKKIEKLENIIGKQTIEIDFQKSGYAHN